jgi:hypothetical protein
LIQPRVSWIARIAVRKFDSERNRGLSLHPLDSQVAVFRHEASWIGMQLAVDDIDGDQLVANILRERRVQRHPGEHSERPSEPYGCYANPH